MRFFFIVLLLNLSVAQAQLIDTGLPAQKACAASSDEFQCMVLYEPVVDFEKWKSWLADRLELDSAAKDTIPPGSYTVVIQFCITETGQLKDVKVVNDPGYGLGRRTMRVIAGCMGIWKPSLCNGRFVKSYHRQPVTFTVVKEEECEDKLPVKFRL